MPPSPSLRYSPSREPRPSHKKGRSFESGLSFKGKDDDLALFKGKDDDLALFNEMQSKEQESFLLQSTDDFEDILSLKFNPLSDRKLGITVPARGEPSGLLNVEEDKNDYEWLLTPPDTPLFPSLDDERKPATAAHSGRPRSQPITISRSSTMERSHNSRGSASPQRLSPSPCSNGSSTFQSRGRPSAPHSSPTTSSRSSTPTRRLSPSPIKSSVPSRRSSTPTPRPSSASGARGVSPARTSRGNSPSPKIKAWQSNIPGFSLEAPANLRTSLADRPASYVRGSSPASRNARDPSSNVRRQSISPTPTRSISSSHSHERDWSNAHSKGSVASSGDDDADSFMSVSGHGSEHSSYRRGIGGFSRNGPVSSSKKPSKAYSSSSAPKRSIDSAIRQMERKSPKDMFRPLLYSVPSTTLYGGKLSSSHHSMISVNSSVTTRSSSPDFSATWPPNTEGSEYDQDYLASGSGRNLKIDVSDKIFSPDKMDTASKDTGLEEIHDLPHVWPGEFHSSSAFGSNATDDQEVDPNNLPDLNPSHPTACAQEGYAQVESSVGALLCFRCGCRYNVTELVEDEVNICPECKLKELKEGTMVAPISFVNADVSCDSIAPSTIVSEEAGSSNASEPYLAASEPVKVTEAGESAINLHISHGEEGEAESETTHQELSRGSCLENFSAASEGKVSAHVLSDVQVTGQMTPSLDPSRLGIPVMNKSNDESPSKLHNTEGAGISVLLFKRSSSNKGPFIQGRSFTATSGSCDAGSFARESTTSMRSSIGYGSVSSSSSIDMGLTRTGMHMQRRLSIRRSDNGSISERNGSFSQASSHTSQDFGPATSAYEDNPDTHGGNEGHIVIEEPEVSSEPAVAVEDPQQLGIDSRLALLEGDCCNKSYRENKIPSLESSVDVLSNQSENSSFPSLVVDKELKLHAVDNNLLKNAVSGEQEESATAQESLTTGLTAEPISVVDQAEVMVAPHDCLAGDMSEINGDNCHPDSLGSQNGVVGGDVPLEPSSQSHERKDASSSASDSSESEVANVVLDEPTAKEDNHHERRRTRSLTLEEATDTILFCSSIVHNLAREAANIAIEKENANLIPPEGSRPMVTIVGQPNPDQDPHGRSIHKRTPKAKKGRRKHPETDTNLSPSKPETPADGDDHKSAGSDTRNVGIPPKIDGSKPPKLESKCNCTIM